MIVMHKEYEVKKLSRGQMRNSLTSFHAKVMYLERELKKPVILFIIGTW